MQPIFAPSSLNFGGVPRGSGGPSLDQSNPFTTLPSFAGGVEIRNVPADATLTVGITGDTARFGVESVFVMAFAEQEVGDLPPGHKGPPPKVKGLQVESQTDGSAPIEITSGQYLLEPVRE